MGIAEMEELLGTLKSILKILECPICLELLKIPVSAGCGHFFCKNCAYEVLQKSYRAPCPLCKRSFTRRSVQEGLQRQTIISNVEKLAKTCSSLTGVNLITPVNVAKSSWTEVDSSASPPKKLRTGFEVDNAANITKKRKSCEEADVQIEITSKSDKKTEDLSEVYSLKKKKSKLVVETLSDSDDELPDLEEILQFDVSSKKSNVCDSSKSKSLEEPLVIAPVKFSSIKTYSRKKISEKAAPVSFIPDSFERAPEQSASNNPVERCEESEQDSEQPENIEQSTETKNQKNKLQTKVTTLKKNTNKVNAEKHLSVLQEDGFLLRLSPNKTDALPMKTKENIVEKPAKHKSSETVDSSSHKKTKKRGRKSVNDSKKNIEHEAASHLPSDKELNRNITENDQCCTLNEIAISPGKENLANAVDDPMLGLVDTAVSVDSVTSPLNARNAQVNKSPGWSRVKKVGKDFKAKQYAILNVEKNSPSLIPKTKLSDPLKEPEMTVINSRTSGLNEENSACKHSNERSEPCILEENVEKVVSLMDLNKPVSLSSEVNDIHYNVDDVAEPEMEQQNVFSSIESPVVNVRSPDSSKNTNEDVNLCFDERLHAVKEISELNSRAFPNQTTKEPMYVSVGNYPVMNREHIPGCNCSDQICKMAKEKACLNLISMEENENLFVEQSQQTSQRLLNPYDEHFLKNNITMLTTKLSSGKIYQSEARKTKVLKKTCLTLDEIQEYSTKSDLSGCTEVLYSAPFMSGQFKLHIDIAEETLNISVLKVIDEVYQRTSLKSIPLPPENINQAPGMYNHIPFEAVLPSSNAESDSSQPDNTSSKLDPYPFLNKFSNEFEVSNPVEGENKDKESIPSNFSGASVQDQNPVQGDEINQKSISEMQPENAEVTVTDPTEPNMHLNVADENNVLEMSEIIPFPPQRNSMPLSYNEDNNDSDKSVHVENIRDELKENIAHDSVPNSKIEVEKTCQMESETLESNKNQPLCSSPCRVTVTSLQSTNEDLRFSNSDSDVDSAPLRTLKEISSINSSRQSAKSRLSLKSRKKLRRVQVYDSSDDSEPEVISSKFVGKVNLEVSKEQLKRTVSPKAVKESTTVPVSEVTDMPSTYNSMLSEDTNENPSEIIIEIENITEKIKSLEEKLKQCGHAEKENVDSSKKGSSVSDSDSSSDLFSQSVPPTP